MSATFPFEHKGAHIFGDIYSPIARVRFFSPYTKYSIWLNMVVDTGADYSILPKYSATWLGISLAEHCTVETTHGVGGAQTTYFLKDKMRVILGTYEIYAPVAFFDNNSIPPLMGRLGLIEQFKVIFHNRKVEFTR